MPEPITRIAAHLKAQVHEPMLRPTTPHNAIEAIHRRRSATSFDPARSMPDATLVELLGHATKAPSGFNLQPWRFIAVRDPRRRQALRQCAFGQWKIAQAPVVLIVLGHLNPHRTHLEPMLELRDRRGATTPELSGRTRANATRSLERLGDRTTWATRSVMMAVATLLIAAESLGVDSAVMEGFVEEKVRATFGIPDDHAICALVALGYRPEGEGCVPDPGRFGLDAVCYEEHFGQPWTLGEPEELDSPGRAE